EEEPVMRVGGIPYPVNILQRGIQRRVIADGFVGAKEIIVDRSRAANDRDAMLVVKKRRTTKGAIAADGNQTVDPSVLQLLRRPLPTFRRAEFRGACTLEYGAAG